MLSKLVTLCAVVLIGLAVYVLTDPVRISPVKASPIVIQPQKIILPRSVAPLALVDTINTLYVPSAGIVLPVQRGVYDTTKMTWNVPGNLAYLADGSVAPNSLAGTSYIYGHKNKYAFSKLSKLQIGDVAVIKNGVNSFYYELVDSRITSPSDLSLFTTEGQPTLILQTCTGLINEYRAQYIFRLKRTV